MADFPFSLCSILINKLTTGTMKEEATWYGYDPDSLIEKLTIWLSEGAPEWKI